jgi:hypothetical protein
MPDYLSVRMAAGTAASVLSFAALAAGNPVHEQFNGLDADQRGERIARLLSTNGRACHSVRREMLQGQLPDGTALWSFSCVAGADHQLAIFPDGSTQMFSCEEVSKSKDMLPCFTPVPKK